MLLSKSPITTDMEMLTREVERFAQNKKLEIETLNIRENYRKEFMGNVSHELKTPLFTIQGYVLTLLDGAMDDHKVRKKYLLGASKGVERLVHIVKDLDMITQLELGELVLEKGEFDLVTLVQNVFDLLEILMTYYDLKITFKSIFMIVFILSVEIKTPPRFGSAPPLSPVPAPRGVTGILFSLQMRITLLISSAVRGFMAI